MIEYDIYAFTMQKYKFFGQVDRVEFRFFSLSHNFVCIDIQMRRIPLKGMNPVLIWYDRKLPEVDLIPHNSIWLWCIMGQIDHRECAVIGNNPKHES